MKGRSILGALFSASLLAMAAWAPAVGIICRVTPGANPLQVARRNNLILARQATGSPFLLFNVRGRGTEAEAMKRLSNDREVVWVTVNAKFEYPETESSKGSTVAAIFDTEVAFAENEAMWSQINYTTPPSNPYNRKVTVAVLDTGLSTQQPDLWPNVVATADFVEGSTSVNDYPMGVDTNLNQDYDEGVGHGTMVTGVIAQVAQHADLIICKVADSDGISTAWDLIEGMVYAVQHSAEIINISLGGPNPLDPFGEVLDWAESEGALVVSPIGNDSSNLALYPSVYAKAVCVAGLDDTLHKAEFSNYHATADVAAPATGIRSAWWTGEMAVWSGTSFSAPLVTGALADAMRGRPPITPQQMRHALNESSTNIDGTNPSFAGMIGKLLDCTELREEILEP